MNPEFRRNVLLELTLHRLIAMPLILLLIYAAAGLDGDTGSVSSAAMTVMLGLLVLWGTRLAADAVLGEVVARTWDSQRMSALGPLSMSWGKLLGSTVFVWYGAALSIPALFYGPDSGLDTLLAVAVVGLMAQAVALFVSLLVQRLRPERLRFQVTAAQLFGIGVAIVAWSILSEGYLSMPPVGRAIEPAWYGMTVRIDELVVSTALAFLAWACFGIYRLMRGELQFRCWPVGWTGFILFCAVYVGGFPSERAVISSMSAVDVSEVDVLLRLLAAYVTVLTLTWLGAYAEPKGFVRLRQWGAALRSRDPRSILETTPVWVPSALVGLVLGIVLVTVWSQSPDAQAMIVYRFSNMESAGAFTIALFLFLLRDIGVIHFLTLDGRKRHIHLTSLVYLVVLYVLIPIILDTAGFDDAMPVFIPFAEGHPLLIVLPVLAQVGIVATLLVLRWKKVAESIARS